MSAEIKTLHERQFLRASRAMMDALDVAEGMSSHELICFRHNLDQFITQMIEEAEANASAKKFPMGRHDWGRDER